MKIYGLIITFILSPAGNLWAKKAKRQSLQWEELKVFEFDTPKPAKTAKPGKMGKKAKGKAGSKKKLLKVKTKLKQQIKLKGFMIPMEFSKNKKLSEFLLVPYVPSCMHVPPPPLNQIIHVKMKKGKETKPNYMPIEVVGKMALSKTKDKKSGAYFLLTAESVKEAKFEAPKQPGSHLPGSTPTPQKPNKKAKKK